MVKGELKGKALAKVNQQAAVEFNEAALEACAYCGRWAGGFGGGKTLYGTGLLQVRPMKGEKEGARLQLEYS